MRNPLIEPAKSRTRVWPIVSAKPSTTTRPTSPTTRQCNAASTSHAVTDGLHSLSTRSQRGLKQIKADFGLIYRLVVTSVKNRFSSLCSYLLTRVADDTLLLL